MGASQSNKGPQQVTALHKVKPGEKTGPWGYRYQPQKVENCTEVVVKTSTWTRESHGLYDFEGKDTLSKSFKIHGSQRVLRSDSEVVFQQVDNYTKMRFIDDEEAMVQSERDKIICRILQKDGKYWLFHKHYVDEILQDTLEKKPEEKCWRVVRECSIPEMDRPCIKLGKGDLIKVGRVRFKIRDIMSPVYEKIEAENVEKRIQFHDQFPSFNENSISKSMSAVLNAHSENSAESEYDDEESQDHASSHNPAQSDRQVLLENTINNNGQGDVLAEAEQMLQDHSFDTDSEAEGEPGAPPRARRLRNIGQQPTQLVAPADMATSIHHENIVQAQTQAAMTVDIESNLMQSAMVTGQNYNASNQGSTNPMNLAFGQGTNNILEMGSSDPFSTDKKGKGIKKPKKKKKNTQQKLLEEGEKDKAKVSKSQVSDKEMPVCRICLMDDNEIDNPLFAPCKCSGSMRLIHHQCLKTWFHNKRITKVTAIVTTYFWRNLECELCKTAYPYETRSLDGKSMLNIIEYDTPVPEFEEDPNYYIVLESISSNTSKVIHVVNMAHISRLYIGRGHDAHVRVTDISVSRVHAVLAKTTGGFYTLEDNDSKFGTLALVKHPIELKPKQNNCIQVGRTCFNFEVKSSGGPFSNCLCFGQKQKKEMESDPNMWHTVDGINYWPGAFADDRFNLFMSKRSNRGTRNRKRVQVRQLSDNTGISPQKRQPYANVPTQNMDEGLAPNQGVEMQGIPSEMMFIQAQNSRNAEQRLENPTIRSQATLSEQQPVSGIQPSGRSAVQQAPVVRQDNREIISEPEEEDQEYDDEDEEVEEEEEDEDEEEADAPDNAAEQQRIREMEEHQFNEAIRQSLAISSQPLQVQQERQEMMDQLDSHIRAQEQINAAGEGGEPPIENQQEEEKKEEDSDLPVPVDSAINQFQEAVPGNRNTMKLHLQSQRVTNPATDTDIIGEDESTKRVVGGNAANDFKLMNKLSTQRTVTGKASDQKRFGIGMELEGTKDESQMTVNNMQVQSEMDVTHMSGGQGQPGPYIPESVGRLGGKAQLLDQPTSPDGKLKHKSFVMSMVAPEAIQEEENKFEDGGTPHQSDAEGVRDARPQDSPARQAQAQEQQLVLGAHGTELGDHRIEVDNPSAAAAEQEHKNE